MVVSCENAREALPPRLIIGFSTGHVGTTSLSARRSYHCSCESRANCKCSLSHYGFFHEAGKRLGLQSTHASLRDWHEAPLEGSLTAREAELVSSAYLPEWNKHPRALILSHDTLYLYRGILAAVPHQQLLFVRIRRSRAEFIASFGKYDAMSRDWYCLEPSSHDRASPMPESSWEEMCMRDKAAWFCDEVEARWQRLRAEHPRLAVLEVEWSKEEPGSFDALARSIASAAGLRQAEGGAAHRHAGSVKDRR